MIFYTSCLIFSSLIVSFACSLLAERKKYHLFTFIVRNKAYICKMRTCQSWYECWAPCARVYSVFGQCLFLTYAPSLLLSKTAAHFRVLHTRYFDMRWHSISPSRENIPVWLFPFSLFFAPFVLMFMHTRIANIFICDKKKRMNILLLLFCFMRFSFFSFFISFFLTPPAPYPPNRLCIICGWKASLS